MIGAGYLRDTHLSCSGRVLVAAAQGVNLLLSVLTPLVAGLTVRRLLLCSNHLLRTRAAMP